MPVKERYGSVDEALAELLPRDEPHVMEPSAIPVTTGPWPDGEDVATSVITHVADSLRRAVERV